MIKNIKGNFSIAKTIMIAITGLFVIFLVNVIATLIIITHDTSNMVELNQRLSFLVTMQWFFLGLGIVLMSFIVGWWLKKGLKENKSYQELWAILNAIYLSQAIIEFNMDGTVITANEKFLDAVGYSLDELVGRHHSILVPPEYKSSQEYRAFWDKLNRGEYDQAEYKRLKKNGEEVWLQSSYNPIIDDHGSPKKIIKVATDVTERKHQEAALAKMTQNLREVGHQIITDSNELSIGIAQLENTVIAQAASASEQAASVTEISATIEEIKTTTQQTHEKAKQLGESAERTSKEAENGKAAIEKMNEAMHVLQDKIGQISTTILSLNEKTQQIGEITETVADIAKQSKLLALNASIEAAKAGESGKGFAVVAGEVKDLAEKSQLSTERVQKILQDIRKTAERAVLVTDNGTKSVDESLHQVKLSGDIINALGEIIEISSLASLHIVSAVREESVAIGQIDLSMKEVNKVTSLFSAATEQTKQAIINLSKVSDSLKNTANAYKE